MAETDLNGVIGAHYIVLCGCCGKRQEYPEVLSMNGLTSITVFKIERWLQLQGWVQKLARGWCCPRCVKIRFYQDGSYKPKRQRRARKEEKIA